MQTRLVRVVCCLAVASLPLAAQLDSNCTVNVLNRTVTVNPDGTWAVGNVPSVGGLIRARATCSSNGVTRSGQSEFFVLGSGQIVNAPPIDFTTFTPPPESISLAAPQTVLRGLGLTSQITVTGRMADGTSRNLSTLAVGTTYLSSNPGIVSVDTSGLARAISAGSAIITATNDGAFAMLTFEVRPLVDSDQDGIPDDDEVRLGLNPNNPVDALEDLDRDTLSNLDEFRLNSDLRNRDSDGDGIADGTEVSLGLNPVVADATTTVNGRVLDGAGAPVAGAGVTVLGALTGVTDAAGAFSVRFVPAGLGSLTVNAVFSSSASVFAASSAAVAPIAGGVTDAGVIRLAAAGGTVTGLVTNAAGQPVAGVAVSVEGGGIARGTTTDATGRYSATSLIGGPVAVSAVDPVSGLQARATGTLVAGGSLSVNLQLRAAGRVAGTAFRVGGTSPAVRVPVTITADGTSATVLTDSLGRFSFDGVPVASFVVEIQDAATGDRGRTLGTLAANGEVRVANVTFNGVGRVVVTVRSGSNNLPGANVTLTGQTVFGGTLNGVTASDGTITFPQVLAGAFTVSATNPGNGQSGSIAGSVANGAISNVTVTLEGGAGAGTISGRLFDTSGAVPVAGFTVRLLDIRGKPQAQTPSLADGAFRFDNVALGAYNLDAVDSTGRVQARETSLVLASAGDSAVRNLVVVSKGTVAGRVLNPDSSPFANQPVTLRSNNPAVGGFFSATTDSAGQYSISGVPVGPFYVASADPVRRLLAERTGQLATGEVATADLTLVSNAVTLPLNRFDANNYVYDVAADGTLRAGTQTVFTNALELDLILGTSTVRFTGSTSAAADQFGRQITIDQSMAGLEVTRKILVPRDGYFARYLEVVRNPGSAPVTIGIRVSATTNSTSIIETSGGTNALDMSDSPARSRWVVVDDTSDAESFSKPAVGFSFDGQGAAARVAAASFAGGRLSYEWTNIVIPAGGTVAFLHFASQQNVRLSARISAEHLGLMPPEGLAGFTATEAAAVQNFIVPPGTASFLAAMPPLSGGVTGRVTDFTGTVPFPNAGLSIRSRNAFFNRARTAASNSLGNYTLAATLNDLGTSTALPVGPVEIAATFRPTGPLGSGELVDVTIPASVDGSGSTVINVPFSSTGNVQVRQVWPSGPPTGACDASQVTLTGPTFPFSTRSPLDATGNATFTGLAPGAYRLNYSIQHPQDGYLFSGFCRREGGTLAVEQQIQVVAAQATLPASVIPPVGNVTGVVTDPTGAPVANIEVRGGPANAGRITFTDAAGNYSLRDLPAGVNPIAAQDNTLLSSENRTSGPLQVTVVAGQTVNRPIVLAVFGTVRVTVRQFSGAPAIGFNVSLTETLVNGTRSRSTNTDASGVATFSDVPPGPLTVLSYPTFALFRHQATTTATAVGGSTVDVELTMPQVGTVTGLISLPTGLPLANAFVEFRFSNDSVNQPFIRSDATGNYTMGTVPFGVPFKIQVRRNDANNTLTILDNQTISSPTETRNITLPAIATVRVTVLNASGAPLANSRVELLDSAGTLRALTTTTTGVVSFAGVREGNFSVKAFPPGNFVSPLGVGSGTITVGSEGSTIDLTIRPGITGNIQGSVYAADGLTVVPFSGVTIFDVATGSDLSRTACGSEFCPGIFADENGRFSLANATVSSLGFRVVATYQGITAQQTGTLTTPGQIVTADISLPLSVVKGTIFFSDGVTAVPFANVFASQVQSGLTASADSTGRYAILGLSPGAFTLSASDDESALTGSVNATLAAVSTPLALNLSLQPGGSVTGQLRDSASQPVSGGLVGLTDSTGLTAFTRTTTTDAGGNFRFDRIPLGDFVVQAKHPMTGVSATSAGRLAAANQPAVLNLALPAIGELRGRVLRQDGSSGAGNADVVVSGLSGVGPLGGFETFTATDASGNYLTAGAQLGTTRVVGSDAVDTRLVGLGDGVVSAIIPAVINATFGNAVRLGEVNLDGADGFRYDLGCNGEIIFGGSVDGSADPAFAGGVRSPYPMGSCTAGQTENGGRQILFGPASPGSIVASRKVYVPTAGKFVRYLETLTNPTASPVTLDFIVTGTLASFSNTRILTAPGATSNRYAVTDSTQCCEPVIAHVFAGAGGRVGLLSSRFIDGVSGINYGWRVTIEPGQSISLLHFVAQRMRTDAAGADSQAQALAGLTDPDALNGLTTAERTRIVNFQVP